MKSNIIGRRGGEKPSFFTFGKRLAVSRLIQRASFTSYITSIMLICIGGVCVPYTAVLPIVLLSLRWVAQKLHDAGLLPQFLQGILHLHKNAQPSSSDINGTSPSRCCSHKDVPTGPSRVQTLAAADDFYRLVDNDAWIVCKFTAVWCKPCQAIHPVYEQLSAASYPTSVSFLTIDVDDFDKIASEYKVAMMPTFLVLKGKEVKGTYRGSNEHELRSFVAEHVRP